MAAIGHALGYVVDRDAADFSRGALVKVISDLAKNPKTGKIKVIGHSMGGRLTTEALMQLAIADRKDVLNRLEIVLADPDLDVDLFMEQAQIIGPMQPPLIVFAATDDKALRFSQKLAAERDRFGKVDVRDHRVQQQVAALGVRVVDFTGL